MQYSVFSGKVIEIPEGGFRAREFSSKIKRAKKIFFIDLLIKSGQKERFLEYFSA